MAKTHKSKLAEALEKEVPPLDKDPESVVWVFDAMAVVQALVQIPDTFGELAEQSNSRQMMLYELTLFLTHTQKFQLKMLNT